MQGKMVGKLTLHKGRLKLNFQTAFCVHIKVAIYLARMRLSLSSLNIND